MYELRTFEFLLRAEQPIAHASGTRGNRSLLMTRGVMQPDGEVEQAPCVTGDTMRHGLREAVAYAYLDAAGMFDDPKLSKAAARLLFNGGMVTGRGDATNVRLDFYRELSSLCPGLGLLGGCVDNRVTPGYIEADDALLICDETRHLMPEWVLEWYESNNRAIDEASANVETAQRVRMDCMLNPSVQRILDPHDQADVTAQLMSAEAAHEADDEPSRERAKSSMLPRTYERVVSGAMFYWSVSAHLYSELEFDTFRVMVGAFLSRAKVGGNRGRGCGLIKPVIGRDVTIAPMSQRSAVMDKNELAMKAGELFRSHVAANKDRVREFLARADA